MYDWPHAFIKAAETIDQTFDVALKAKDRMMKAGFVDVIEYKYKIFAGPWPADKKWHADVDVVECVGMAVHRDATIVRKDKVFDQRLEE
ncbi:hypothetical protein VTL71DRAFT_6851 [Oculimacula yallundae]|uniref:Uncharacterized protein n=1 Tax=Oculimacula yallundae TaxID=86028 RepID=A0ABR4BWM2_9HELO